MSYNLSNAAQGLTATLTNAGLTGLSGAALTFSTSATGGATGIVYSNKGKFNTVGNFSSAAAPTFDAASSGAVAGVSASGSAFRPLVAQQPVAGSSFNFIGSICSFVFGLDPSGNVRVAQGRVVQYSDTSALSTVAPLPLLPDWFTPFAYVVVKLTSATPASWTFGSNVWNAAGVTIDPPVNISTLPANDPVGA